MDWWTHVVTFLLGLGAGWTLKIFISNRSTRISRTSKVSQKNNSAGGDIVGGDSHKNNRR